MEVETEAVAVVAVVRTTEVEGVVIAAEVISWRGWSSMDTKTSPLHSVFLPMSVSTFAISVVFLKVVVSNMTTSPSINGV